MTKHLLIAVLAAHLLPGLALGQEVTGPFGFKWGMTRDQIIQIVGKDAIDEKGSKDDVLALTTAPKPYSAFDTYVLLISPSQGLLKISALGKTIPSSVFGSELRSAFIDLRDALSNTYGMADPMYDYLKSGSIWKDRQDWMMGLLKKERVLTAYWTPKGIATHVTAIELNAAALSTEKGWLRLSYEFDGFEQYETFKETKAAGVL